MTVGNGAMQNCAWKVTSASADLDETATGAGSRCSVGRLGDERDRPGERGYLNGRGRRTSSDRYDRPDVRYGDQSAAEGPIAPAFPAVLTSGTGGHRRSAAPRPRARPSGVTRATKSRLRYGAIPGPVRRPVRTATPSRLDRYDDYWLAGSPPACPLLPPLSYPLVVYQESVEIPVPDERHLPAAGQGRAIRLYRERHRSRPRERVRGMNAALETGVAGVGQMAPARRHARPRQMVVAVVVAVVGLVAGVLTYRAWPPARFVSGRGRATTHMYALSSGRRARLRRSGARRRARHRGPRYSPPGRRPSGRIFRRRRHEQAAAAAALYADEDPQQRRCHAGNRTRSQQRGLAGAA